MKIDTLTWWQYPMKPVRVDKTIFGKIDSSEYTMESKFDGHRILCITKGQTQIWSRQKNPIQLPKEIKEQLTILKPPKGTVFDGEIWNPFKRGGWHKSNPGDCYLSLWDIIRIGRHDLSKEPIEKRREILRDLMKKDCPNIRPVKIFEATLKECNRIHKRAVEIRKQKGLKAGYVHGVVLKKNRSIRRDHCKRSIEHPDWLKIVFDGMEGWEPDLK